MDIKQLEEMIEPSAMKMARENQARLDSLASATGATDNLLKIAQNLDYFKSLTRYTANQDLLSQFSQNFLQSNLAIDGSIAGIVNSLAESNLLNSSVFESIKFNKTIIDAFEATNLELKPRTQSILPEGFTSKNQIGDLSSIMSKATEIFKYYEQFGELESFKAISRLENFPNYKVWTQNYYKARDITEDSLAEAKNIDASISDEVSSVDDFNKLSEERQSILLSLYSNYYYPIILTYLIIGIWWNIFLNEDLDLSNRVFVYFESTKGVFSYLSTNVYRPVSGVIDGLVASFIYINFPEFKRNSKDVGVKKATKMLFYSSDSFINRSMLKGYRVITEDNTYLRESHHINAIGIEILSKGTIVRVIEKEGKSWLLVEPLFNTETGKGWILRSSTTTLNRPGIVGDSTF